MSYSTHQSEWGGESWDIRDSFGEVVARFRYRENADLISAELNQAEKDKWWGRQNVFSLDDTTAQMASDLISDAQWSIARSRPFRVRWDYRDSYAETMWM